MGGLHTWLQVSNSQGEIQIPEFRSLGLPESESLGPGPRSLCSFNRNTQHLRHNFYKCNVQLSGVKYSHVVQPISRAFALAKLKLYPLNGDSLFSPSPNPRQPAFTFCLDEFGGSRYLLIAGFIKYLSYFTWPKS